VPGSSYRRSVAHSTFQMESRGGVVKTVCKYFAMAPNPPNNIAMPSESQLILAPPAFLIASHDHPVKRLRQAFARRVRSWLIRPRANPFLS